MNKLYFGDNLNILKELYQQHPQGFIDLIYNDPPFNSKRNYNVLFESVDLKDATAQKEAFADTWSNVSYMDTLNELSELDISLYNFLKNLDNTNISKGAISYLVTMAIRLWYMHKLLKDTGSFYLHCDPTMSHYLKILCDLIFGEKNFRNEIIWHYGERLMHNRYKFNEKHDVIFFYAKSKNTIIKNQIVEEWTKEEISEKRARKILTDENGKEYIWDNRAVSKGIPARKQFIEDIIKKGKAIDDVWDIPIILSTSKERLGYPTQKPEELMERIITASSKEGDLIADFFCGCGTTIAAAQKLNRKWLGVDISHLAVRLIKKRLIDSYGEEIGKTFEVHGFPEDPDSARELANKVQGGRLEFEEWIIEVLLHGITNEQRNVMGYDGYRTFTINDKKYIVMIEVKSGNTNPSQLNHFIKTIEDKGGSMGVFVCFKEYITRNMQLIAKKQGLFVDDFGYTHQEKDKIQIISVEDLLDNRRPAIPLSTVETFKKAEKKRTTIDGTQGDLEI